MFLGGELLEVAAADVFHYQVGPITKKVEIEDANEMRMLEFGHDLALLDDLGPAARSNRLLGKLEHPLLLELRMDNAEDLRLAAVRKPADDQVFADRGGHGRFRGPRIRIAARRERTGITC